MCSGVYSTVRDTAKEVSGVSMIEKKAFKGQTLSEATGLDPKRLKPLGAPKVSTRTPLAIGTQTGGTRQTLGK